MISIQTTVHDGHIFHWTEEALKSKSRIIGFYFDDNGIPQPIKRNSLYGEHIYMWEKHNIG